MIPLLRPVYRLQKFFRHLKFKMMARQLRRPSGMAGNKVGQMMNKANKFLYDFTLEQMQLKTGESVLEIGFGNGRFFPKLFAAAADLKIAGIDFSSTMVQAAKEYNRQPISDGRLNIIQGASDALPFPENSFDKIFCINVIYFWDNPLPHLKEIQRVLKPGGKFFATIRTRESMALMPFTKYGFTSYTAAEWEKPVTVSGLRFTGAVKTTEPEVEFEGKPFLVESYCMIAEKKN